MAFPTRLAVVAALILPMAAYAQSVRPDGRAPLAPSPSGQNALATFNRLDRDGDRALAMGELRMRGREKAAEALFALLDADGDGRLSVTELGAAGGALLARFDAYDVNKDGFVTRREFPNFIDPLLVAALDRNHDHRLALAELRPGFAGARAQAAPASAARHLRAHAKPQPQPQAWCWITGFGSDRWTIEAPVAWGRCRTR